MIQYPLAKPDINQDDIESVTQVLKSEQLSRGPVVAEFEKEFCHITNSKYACATSSGSAALIVAMQSLGVKAGDEVITVSFTVPATVNSIVAIGAKPIMVDIELKSLGMCPLALEQAISKNTSAIIVVHAFGQSADMSSLLKISEMYNIPVIEDACEATGNSFNNISLGTFADIGVFAFYPNKQITSGEGGILVTNNDSLLQKFKLLRNHGRTMDGKLFDQVSFGWNFRMSDINAALALSQIKRIKKIVSQRQKIAQYYQNELQPVIDLICPKFNYSEQNSAWFVYVIRLLKANRDELMVHLNKNGIQSGRYFAPVHLQPYYKSIFSMTTLPNTENISSQTLALPFYNQLKGTDVRIICNKIKEFLV